MADARWSFTAPWSAVLHSTCVSSVMDESSKVRLYTRDGGDFGGSTAGGGAGAITPPGTESAFRVLPDAFEPPGRHGSSLGTEPQLRVLPISIFIAHVVALRTAAM